jgi:lipopolysaccharide biosynthesis regulator YciM
LPRAREIAVVLKEATIPHFCDTYVWVEVSLGQQLEQAVNILEGVVKETEGIAIFNYHLGIAYQKKGDSKKAIEQMNLVLKHSGSDTDLSDKANQVLQQLAQ